MVCLIVVDNLRDLIDSVLLSIATSWEVLVNENIFEVLEFIEKYARVEGSQDEMEYDDEAGGEVNQLNLDFIDDKTNFQDQELTDYRLMNVTRDLQDAISDTYMAYDLNLVAVDPENFVSEFVDEVSYEFDEFLGFWITHPKV